jgi:hypothetical protein
MNVEQGFGKGRSWPILRHFIHSARETAENHEKSIIQPRFRQYAKTSHVTLGTETNYEILRI